MGRPTGTVTFLFTDIVGSTSLWEQAPEDMRHALARHDVILKQSVSNCEGTVFSTGGDGMAIAFARAVDAVSCAIDAQRCLAAEPWPQSAAISVRMAIHTGEAHERDGDYFGSPLNRAARVMSVAEGGQVLVSGATAALLEPAPSGVQVVPLGAMQLRGLSAPIQLFTLRAEGLRVPDRAPAQLSPGRGNIPHPTTTFVGHAIELKEMAADLPSRRLVTLTGPGGVGKTRMALEAAALAEQDYPEGVWIVELGPVVTEEAVPNAVATVFGAGPQPGMTLEDSIIDVLSGQRLLLILDNCEHLLDAVVRLVDRVVGECGSVTVLATSREPLGLGGERVHVVSSLDPTLEGVELFCDRAQAADSRATFSEKDLVAIGRICARLDGIPLAIELAAARSRALGPAELLQRLDDRFRLLRGGLRGGAERHQTLRTTVAWSYQLLSPEQQSLFARLSVFAGGFDLQAAEAICAGDGIEAGEIVDLLADLVDKSMLGADKTSGLTRYRLLETLRSFGEERLADQGGTTSLRDSHLAHYVQIAAEAGGAFMGPQQESAITTFEREWDNLRAAFDWALDAAHPDDASLIVMVTAWYAAMMLRFEHQDWLQQALDGIGNEHPDFPLISAQYALLLGALLGEPEAAIKRAEVALTNAANSDHPPVLDRLAFMLPDIAFFDRGAGNDASKFLAHCALGIAYMVSGRASEALEAGRTAEVLAGDDRSRLNAIWSMLPSIAAGADPGLVAHYAELYRRSAEWWGAPTHLAHAAMVDGLRAFVAGDGLGAKRWYEESLRIAGPRPSLVRSGALQGLAWVASLLEGPDAADAYITALTDHYSTRFWTYVWMVLESLASHWVSIGHSSDGGVLLGHLEAHSHVHSAMNADRQQALASIRADPEARDAMTRGAAMSRDEVVLFALARLEETAEHRSPM